MNAVIVAVTLHLALVPDHMILLYVLIGSIYYSLTQRLATVINFVLTQQTSAGVNMLCIVCDGTLFRSSRKQLFQVTLARSD